MNEQPLLTERRDRVLLITLNRPDARNAVNLAMAEAMAAALGEKWLLVHGAGPYNRRSVGAPR